MRSASGLSRGGLWFVALAIACGGVGEVGSEAEEQDDDAAPASASHGIQVPEPTGPVDEALAASGENVFQARGCVACHTIGKGRLVGPDLARVTERRKFEWFYRMVMNPDSMLQNDPTARQLLGEYLTPMLYQNVTPEEVRAIWEYLRRATVHRPNANSNQRGPDP